MTDGLVAGANGATKSVLARLDVCSLQEQPGSSGSAEVKGERTIGTDGNTRGDWGAGLNVCCAGIKLLYVAILVSDGSHVFFLISDPSLALQKSMLLTPLLPRAGPTGGLGLAWPAPTMSFTI